MNRQKLKEIAAAAAEGKTDYLELQADGNTYVRKFAPRERLILLGGGHVSQAVCKMAVLLGFEVTVVDDRPMFANYRLFPAAKSVICNAFREAIRSIGILPEDYVCVLTRGHRWDADCLREILSGELPFYLGMIGSRRRVQGLYGILEEEGYDRKQLESIHSPIGLPIKAQTPAEIALSICAEIIQLKREKAGEKIRWLLDRTDADPVLLGFAAKAVASAAAAFILETNGSTPADPGAWMVIDRSGGTCGTIGGGCTEAEVITRARSMKAGESCVLNLDLTEEAGGEGMVCGGTMKVLIESIV